MVLETVQPLLIDGNGMDLEFVVAAEFDQVKTAEGGADLVLRADILFKHILLDMDRFARQFHLGYHISFKPIQGVKEAYGKGRARPYPCPGREIAVVMDLDPVPDLHEGQAS